MANTKKKGGLGAESYFQNIPTLEPDEEEEAPSEAAEDATATVSRQNEEIDVAEGEQTATPSESPQEEFESEVEADFATDAAIEEVTKPGDGSVETTAELDAVAVNGADDSEATTATTALESAAKELVNNDGDATESTAAEQSTEASATAFEARTSPVDDDDLAQAPEEQATDMVDESVEEEEEEEDEPERVKIRRTYALYEETQIALEEMKLAARKQGIKTTLGDILEEAVLLLMEKKGITPDM